MAVLFLKRSRISFRPMKTTLAFFSLLFVACSSPSNPLLPRPGPFQFTGTWVGVYPPGVLGVSLWLTDTDGSVP